MGWTRLRTALAAVLLVAAVQVGSAAGEPHSEPNGPWVVPNQNESLAAIRDYGQLIATLEQIVGSRDGAELTYSPFRAKGTGRQIPIVTIGDGQFGEQRLRSGDIDDSVVVTTTGP